MNIFSFPSIVTTDTNGGSEQLKVIKTPSQIVTGGFFKELDPNAVCYWTLHPMLSRRELTLQLSMRHAESELNILKTETTESH